MAEIGIKFLNNFFEPTLPIVRLTKSKNKMTGTATFVFVQPKTLELIQNPEHFFQEMRLIWKGGQIKTTDISLLFLKGKPFLIKSIFLFKNSKEWFNFLSFMQQYSQEIGLSFTEFDL